MKHLVYLILLVSLGTFAGCKKDYRCECTHSTGTVYYEFHSKPKNAEAVCDGYEEPGYSCEIIED
jgi:hypothetical protein